MFGKLIKSNAHTDYVCQIYGPGEVDASPSPADYAFGTFVRIPLAVGYGHLVGVIYDTVLLNPEFGNLGPRLSPVSDLAVFSPDYLAEKVTLVGITSVYHPWRRRSMRLWSAWMMTPCALSIRRRQAVSRWGTPPSSWL